MAEKRAKIHELIPAEQAKVAAANALVEEGINTFAKKPDHFMGRIKVVTMYDDTRSQENTTDIKELVTTVDDKLAHVWGSLVPALDVTLTKENSNTSDEARADVVVDGVVVLEQVPAIGLLALEKRLRYIQALYNAIPTLDPALAWELDPGAALPGVMRTKHPQESQKTEKVMKVLTLAQATEKHPAQVEKYTMDENVAKVTLQQQSGNVSPATKALWLKRIADLATAVKEARQRANMAEIKPLEVGEKIRAFIHA